MKVKTLGFKWKLPLPAGISIADFYEHTSRTETKIVKDYELFLAPVTHEEKSWWAGVVLRIRDSKNYTKLKENQKGHRLITAEIMEDGDLVEPSFFIADFRTGSGLFSTHHLASTLPALARLFEVKFKQLLERRKEYAMEAASSAMERKSVSKAFQGSPKMEQLCHVRNFPELVKSYDSINTVEWTLSSFGTTFAPFRRLQKVSKSEKVIFKLDDVEANLFGATEDIIEASQNPHVIEAKVVGRVKGYERAMFLKKDTGLIFCERDYDSVVNKMSLDLDDWQTSIENCEMIKLLIKDAADEDVKLLLSN